MAFSMDWIFAILTLGCLVFIIQILVDYTKQAGDIRPQLRTVSQIQERHNMEIEKVQKLIKTAEAEGAKLDARIADLERRHDELEEVHKGLQKKEEDEA
jgi:hypothetical protein